jgi:hypothetical protein
MTFQIKFYLYKQKIQLMEREQHELYEYARKDWSKKGCIFILCFYFSQFIFCLSPLNFLILD